MARRVSVDSEFGGALTMGNVRVAGPQHFVTGSYLIVGPEPLVGSVAGPVQHDTTLHLAPIGNFYAATFDARVIVSERIVTLAECITAATLGEPIATTSPRFYPDLSITATDSWWTGTSSSRFTSISMHDRRLSPFFDRLARIERGDWDQLRGAPPSTRALENARAILRHLSGGPLTPKKVVAADGRVVLYFTSGEKYSNVEVLSSGVMLMLNSDGQGVPEVKRFTLSKLAAVVDKIHAHVA